MAVPEIPPKYLDELNRLVAYFNPVGNDPTFLVLKAHLLAEEALYEYLEGLAQNPAALSEARLSFSQCLALSKAMHRFSKADWWGWIALSKLNALRNQLAHNLEPKNTQKRISEFTVFVSESIGVTEDSDIATVFESMVKIGESPFRLVLVALHMSLCGTLDYDPAARIRELVERSKR